MIFNNFSLESRFKAKAVDREYQINIEQQLNAFVADWTKKEPLRINDKMTVTGANAFAKLASLHKQTKGDRGKGGRVSEFYWPVGSKRYRSFAVSEWRETIYGILKDNHFIEEVPKGTPFKKCKFRAECRFHDMSGFSEEAMETIRSQHPFHRKGPSYYDKDVAHMVCGLYSFSGDCDHQSHGLHIVATSGEMYKHLFMNSPHKVRACYREFVVLSI